MQRKGVAGEVASAALEDAYGQGSEEELARQFVERKRLKKPENEKETARFVRRIVAGGFGLQTAYKLLRRWDVRDEVLLAVEGAEEGEERVEAEG